MTAATRRWRGRYVWGSALTVGVVALSLLGVQGGAQAMPFVKPTHVKLELSPSYNKTNQQYHATQRILVHGYLEDAKNKRVHEKVNCWLYDNPALSTINSAKESTNKGVVEWDLTPQGLVASMHGRASSALTMYIGCGGIHRNAALYVSNSAEITLVNP